MTCAKLTTSPCRAHKGLMRRFMAIPVRAGMVMLSASMLAGCITVNAPDGPIVIELNLNITQEVIYRLADDAGNTIDENADIF